MRQVSERVDLALNAERDDSFMEFKPSDIQLFIDTVQDLSQKLSTAEGEIARLKVAVSNDEFNIKRLHEAEQKLSEGEAEVERLLAERTCNGEHARLHLEISTLRQTLGVMMEALALDHEYFYNEEEGVFHVETCHACIKRKEALAVLDKIIGVQS